MNNNWCTNTSTVDSHCSPEYVTVKCRPIYLPREFTVVLITVVYIAPDANASTSTGLLHHSVSLQQNRHPDAVHIVAGGFNHVDLKPVLPKFHQHVKWATRGANTLDKVFTNIKQGYRAKPLPHLGQSDHVSLFLFPAYTTLRKNSPITTRTVKPWPEGASQQLQDCFRTTDFGIFEHPDLNMFNHSVLSYSQHCTDTVTVEKHIRVYPNRKPWMTSKVQKLLKQRNKAFRSGDVALYSSACACLKRTISWTIRGRLRTTCRATTTGRCGWASSTSLTIGPILVLWQVTHHWQRSLTTTSPGLRWKRQRPPDLTLRVITPPSGLGSMR